MKREFIIKQLDKPLDRYYTGTYYLKLDQTHFAYFDGVAVEAHVFKTLKTAVKHYRRMMQIDDTKEYWEFAGDNMFNRNFVITERVPDTTEEIQTWTLEEIMKVAI